jgi:5-methylcytosine-specific restriction endonuclease McrA
METRKPLKADPEKTKAWKLRSQKTAQKKRNPRPERYERSLAMRRSNELCIVCDKPARDLHHVLPVRHFPELVNEVENLVAMCRPCHMNHESAFRRIYANELPACTVALVARLGGPYEVFFVRTYPWRENDS